MLFFLLNIVFSQIMSDYDLLSVHIASLFSWSHLPLNGQMAHFLFLLHKLVFIECNQRWIYSLWVKHGHA